MPAPSPLGLDQSIFQSNLSALSVRFAPLVTLLRNTSLPPDSESISGRDGSQTLRWTDNDGTKHWLGRTSMPTISAPALIDSFDPGMGNILLFTFGHGAEVAMLLNRMLPHQALFVVEPDAAALAASLHLNDFSASIRNGRLCLFMGDDAWQQFERFLISNAGYLIPDRLLGRPWFGRPLIHEITGKLSEAGQRINQSRTTSSPTAHAPNADSSKSKIVVITNVPTPIVRRRAMEWSDAAASLGEPVIRFTLEDPACVHPTAIEAKLRSLNCKALLLLDTVPAALSYQIPDGPKAILISDDRDLDPAWLKTVPGDCLFVVRTEQQRVAAINANCPTNRILVSPPAITTVDAAAPAHTPGTLIAVVGNQFDLSPESCGLHLASHQHLWHAAEEILRKNPDAYHLQNLADLLTAAERRLQISLKSDEVRNGLLSRFENVLWPTIQCESITKALHSRGIPCIQFGSIVNPADSTTTHRGPWPPQSPESWADLGMVIFIGPIRHWTDGLLTAAARGLPIAVLSHNSEDLLADLTSPNAPFPQCLPTISKLAELAAKYNSNSTPVIQIAQQRRTALLANHTTAHRLSRILDTLGIRQPH